jgi:SSS family solute:Na+ symporter
MRFLILMVFSLMAAGSIAHADLEWSELPAVPDDQGFAGMFAGVSDGRLLLAGGANFPIAPPWEGGSKVWHANVFMLDRPDGEWRIVGELPSSRGYGVSVTVDGGMLCIGGGDGSRHFTDCYLLKLDNAELSRTPYPPLPMALAEMTGAVVGRTVHVVGGTRQPDATRAEGVHLMLDLGALEQGWKVASFPGEPRILAVSAVRENSLFVMSGASLAADDEGKPRRTYLTDAWRYGHDRGWQRIAELPRPAVAAPSPAPSIGGSHVLIVGGDDGTHVGFQPPAAHPGFSRSLLAYDVITGTWAEHGVLPDDIVPPVTTPVVEWLSRTIIPSGEIRPATRTSQVLGLSVVSTRASFGWINWLVVAAYLAGMVAIGVWFMKREAASSTDAYFRGGQRIPWWVAGLSIFATMLSSLTFMGIPARAYQTDMSWYIGQLPILLVVPIVAFFYLPFFRNLNLTSAYEYLEKWFNLPCRIFAALSFILFHVGRVAIVLYLPALALAVVSDIDVPTAILAIGVLCVIYTVIGGIEAVVWTDAIQALVLFSGALVCFVLAVIGVEGGLPGMVEIARTNAKGFSNLDWRSFDWSDNSTASVLVLFVAFFFNSFVPYTAGQDVVQRYVTTSDLSAARKSLWTTMWMSVIGSLVFFGLGLAIYAFYKTHPQSLDPAMAKTDSILPFFVMQQLPVGISGLVIAAIFAASQSTISSSLNSIATSWSVDFDKRIFRPNGDDASYLTTAKRVVLVVGALGVATALWMAASDLQSAFAAFNTLIGLTAGSLGGLFALGVFTRRANGAGALIGAVTGFGVVVALEISGAPVAGVLYAFVGCAVSFAVGYLASLLFPCTTATGLSIRG